LRDQGVLHQTMDMRLEISIDDSTEIRHLAMPTQLQALRIMVKQSERSNSAIIVKPVDIRSRVSRIE
jgi:hypothetical protein